MTCKERLCVRQAFNLNCIILYCNSQDMADRAKYRKGFFMKEECRDKVVMLVGIRQRDCGGTYGFGFLSAPL
jgi:hypothetical protein